MISFSLMKNNANKEYMFHSLVQLRSYCINEDLRNGNSQNLFEHLMAFQDNAKPLNEALFLRKKIHLVKQLKCHQPVYNTTAMMIPFHLSPIEYHILIVKDEYRENP